MAPFGLQLLQGPFHAAHEVLGPSGRGDDAVGHGLVQFLFGGACFLRDREVLLESVRATDGDGAGNANQFPVLDLENFLILEIQDPLADLHGSPPWYVELCSERLHN